MTKIVKIARKKCVRNTNRWRMAFRNQYDDLHMLVPDARLIVEIWAYMESVTKELQRRFSGAEFVLVEPNPECVRKLRVKFARSSKVTIVHASTGASTGWVRIPILTFEPASSLLKPSEGMHRYNPDKVSVKEELEGPLCTLDELLSGRKVDIIKLDVQGHELEVLKGAERVLKDVTAFCSSKSNLYPYMKEHPSSQR